jgi:hypothetical protein
MIYPADNSKTPYNKENPNIIRFSGKEDKMPEEQLTHITRNKIAILIDGDNAQANLLPQMLVEAGKYGLVTVRRIYGDWTTSSMNSWKDVLNFHAPLARTPPTAP